MDVQDSNKTSAVTANPLYMMVTPSFETSVLLTFAGFLHAGYIRVA
jgi:hypothetical protein